MRACACGLRRIATCAMPGSSTSLTKVPWPRSSWGSPVSSRSSGCGRDLRRRSALCRGGAPLAEQLVHVADGLHDGLLGLGRDDPVPEGGDAAGHLEVGHDVDLGLFVFLREPELEVRLDAG